MNVGIVSTWFERGAAYVSRQYRDLLKVDNRVFIFARGGEGNGKNDPVWDDGTVTYAEERGPGIPTWIDRTEFVRWLENRSIDVVFFNEQHFWLPLHWCHEAGTKAGAYVDYYNESTLPFFGAYDFLICNTKRHFSAFDWHEQAYYVPWGTNLEIFSPKTLDAVEPDRVVFFHSAGMSPRRKGTDEAIRAFSQVKGLCNLVIHTQVPLESEFPDLEGTISELKHNGKLRIIEATVTAPGLYSLGDVYVYPSRLEGIGLTIAEALASGLPVIVPDQPPMNEFVDPAIGNGTLVKVVRQYARSDGYYWPQCKISEESLVETMQEYVDSRNKLSSRKRSALEFAKARLDWSSRTEQVCRVFKDSKVLKNEQKIFALRTSLAHEHALFGRRIDLWAKYPRLCALGRDARLALRIAGKPLHRLAMKFVG